MGLTVTNGRVAIACFDRDVVIDKAWIIADAGATNTTKLSLAHDSDASAAEVTAPMRITAELDLKAADGFVANTLTNMTITYGTHNNVVPAGEYLIVHVTATAAGLTQAVIGVRYRTKRG